MKKIFHVAVALIALLSSFTVSASADFTSSDSDHLTDIWRQISGVYASSTIHGWIKNIDTNVAFLKSSFSDTRQSVNPIAYYAQQIYNKLGDSSSQDYSTVLSNIKSNSDSLVSYIKLIESDTNNISARSTDLLNKLQEVYLRQGQMQLAITNHIDSASTLNHNDLTSFATQNHADFDFLFNSVFDPVPSGMSTTSSGSYRYPLFYRSDGKTLFGSFGTFILFAINNLTNDSSIYAGGPTLFHIVHQLQQVLASDDDLALKNDNKANEDAATDAFVNGNSSKTSLGTGDIGNLKDVGGSFNDLTSLNGQSSVTSFLDGLTSADGTGQGWFSEATRASLDAVSPATTNKVRAYDVYRGERSSTYVILPDVSFVSPDMYSEPVDVATSVAPDDPYNMSGFEDNYDWLWGDAS